VFSVQTDGQTVERRTGGHEKSAIAPQLKNRHCMAQNKYFLVDLNLKPLKYFPATTSLFTEAIPLQAWTGP
jgi:hypothetical protein